MGYLDSLLRAYVHAAHAAFAVEGPERAFVLHSQGVRRAAAFAYAAPIAFQCRQIHLGQPKTSDERVAQSQRNNGQVKRKRNDASRTLSHLTGGPLRTFRLFCRLSSSLASQHQTREATRLYNLSQRSFNHRREGSRRTVVQYMSPSQSIADNLCCPAGSIWPDRRVGDVMPNSTEDGSSEGFWCG